jgi:ABC-2 type transport system ATP-binding protein
MLKVTNLRKEFDTVVAVDGISLEVKRGELLGLLGPNGAGKTTTIRTILNIIQPDSGEIRFNGKPFIQEMWNDIGYLPEERGLYRKSKIINTILYFATLKGLQKKQARSSALRWLERFGLKDECHRKIEELSKGNQQKVQLIISILHRPRLLILDEPFTGLDPVNQILLKDILLELRLKETAIIFSTHQMEQVEKMCDTICLINKGKQVLDGNLHEIKKRYGTNSIHIEYDGDGEFLKSLDFVRRADVYQNYAELELTDISKSTELLANLNGRLMLRKYEIVEPSLNSIFINVVGGSSKTELVKEKQIPSLPLKLTGKELLQNAQVRKALFSLIVVFLLTLGSIIITGFKDTQHLISSAILVALTLFSAFRFVQVRKKVEKEMMAKQSSGGRL